MALVNISGHESFVTRITKPIMAGGPSLCSFHSIDDIALGTYVTAVENSTVRFQGYIKRKSRSRNKDRQGMYEYEAVCRAYYLAAQEDETVTGVGDQEDEFSGNGAEYQTWLLREEPNQHVIWPPTGTEPEIYDDTSSPSSMPDNIVSVGEVEENSLPSHVKLEVRKYREKRFPVLADFDYSIKPTMQQIKKDPAFAKYGRVFKIMQPEDPTKEYTEKILQNPSVGGCKFFIKGHPGANPNTPEKENFSLSASINPKKEKKTLTKKGTGGGADIPGTETVKKNFCHVDMHFAHGILLPRVTGAHGTEVNKQQCYVRARYLEKIEPYSVSLGGINNVHRLTAINHVEIEVSYDVFDGKYRDFTFGGAEGLLDSVKDEGNGVWTHDLNGTYIEEEGESRAEELLEKALLHYDVLRYSTDITLAGNNFSNIKKVSFEGKTILLDSIEWTFGFNPSENRTHYKGMRLISGFSKNLLEKNRWIQKQEIQREDKKQKNKSIEVKDPINHIESVKLYAKVAWNYDEVEGDLSECEFCEKQANDSWIGVSKLGWIDQVACRGCRADTAGDNTIFEVERIKGDIARLGVTRDLYRTVRVVYDRGSRVGFFHLILKTSTPNVAIAKLIVTEDVEPDPWLNLADNYISTGISDGVQTVAKHNKMLIEIPNLWNVGGAGNFYFTTKTPVKVSFPWQGVPIEPVLLNEANKLWESNRKNGFTSIATYTKVT